MQVMHMKYKVVLHESEEGFAVSCLACRLLVTRRTEDEAIENIQDAIRDYLAAVDEIVKEGLVREVEVVA
jgi:predicted RNase H-like HicB family nuclease